jgi:hypothetical protein
MDEAAPHRRVDDRPRVAPFAETAGHDRRIERRVPDAVDGAGSDV